MSFDTTICRKKAAKGVYVPSRYKQAAETFSSQSSREASNDTKFRATESIQQSAVSSKHNETVFGKRNASTKFTSTPAVKGQYLLPPIDASAITDASGFLYVPHMKEKTTSASSTVAKNPSRRNRVGDQTLNAAPSQRIRRNSNQPNKNDEMEMELLYSEYLQVKLLESNAKKALVERSKNALEKIHQVCYLIEELMKKNGKYQKEADFVSYFIMLHQHLKTQEEMLVPTLEFLPAFEKQYEEIAKAVDIVRHHLEVRDVILPDPGSEDEIILLLQNMRNVLSTILNGVRDGEKINLAATDACTFVNQGKLIAEEINRAYELISETDDLLLSEAALKVSSLCLSDTYTKQL